MSSDLAIGVQDLSKCYQIYDRPQDRLKQMLARSRRKYYREFWASRGVSFQVARGETVGIIGRNGSGKSTLLQMICGTLNPTSGSVRVNGKVAALLELGSGFNPEFTGRENVYMSAAIYGLTRDQVDSRFDKIAAFADIGDHIEQPVKNYSSGMYVRLAFAVIAHVDADILVIDEALAVGDAVFTQKCMRFIRSFKATGTLLFVSHDMNSVLNLCERVIWLHEGKLREAGPAKDIAENYLQYTLQEVYGEAAALKAIDRTEGSSNDATSNESKVTEDKEISLAID
jgi:lipopolysaccharide transport system ATP-binding protein